MNDRDAIAQAQGLYRATCERLKKRPRETAGEIANVSGARVAVPFGSTGKLAGPIGWPARASPTSMALN